MTRRITRRDFCCVAAAPIVLPSLLRLQSSGASVASSRMGIASTSFGAALPPGNVPPATASPAQRGAAGPPRVWDANAFLEKCHSLGAAGVQTQLNGDLTRLRQRAENLHMWIEGMVSIPRTGDRSQFERALMDARTAGATVVRAAMLSGRRYESFSSHDEWKRWVEQCHAALKLAVPIVEKQKIILAIENHKDWTLEDMERVLKSYSSEYVGVCLDFGNNIALLDDPIEMAEVLAPYTRATHVKDMAVRPYADGFLLSEVPLGTGVLDLQRIVSTVQRANPNVRFSLEMITRDPLKVPCLSRQYWAVFPGREGKYLAQTLRLVNERGSAGPLPTVSELTSEKRVQVEEENVRACLRYEAANRLIR